MITLDHLPADEKRTDGLTVDGRDANPVSFELPRWYPKTPFSGFLFASVISVIAWAILSGAVRLVAEAMLASS